MGKLTDLIKDLVSGGKTEKDPNEKTYEGDNRDDRDGSDYDAEED